MSELNAKHNTPMSALNAIFQKWEYVFRDRPDMFQDLRDWRDRYLHVFTATHRLDPMLLHGPERNILLTKMAVMDNLQKAMENGILETATISENEDDFGYSVSAKVYILADRKKD